MPPAMPARPRALPTGPGGAHARRAAVALLAGAAFAVGPAVLPLAGTGSLQGLSAPAAHAAPLPGAPDTAETDAAEVADASPLLVTEIAPDTVGYDDFEFFEVTNISATPVRLGGEDGHRFSYVYVDATDTARDVPLVLDEGVDLAPGASLVVWLSYETSTVDSFAHAESDLLAHWGAGEDAQVVRATGQSGMANGGDRGIRVLDPAGAEVTRSYYPAGSVAVGQSAHFRLPAGADDLSAALFSGPADATPGATDPEQLIAATPEEPEEPTTPEEPTEPEEPTTPEEPTEPEEPETPEEPTEPEEPETPEEPTEPEEPTTPEEPAEPEQPAGSPAAPPADSPVGHLQITEVTPDSSNVGGADGYEFIELYNATDAPISLVDHALRYLYTSDGVTITNAADWPLVPDDAVVEPGGAVVIWVKNGANDALTTADFAAHYGVDPAALTVVETATAGMANGSGRGLELTTRTGDSIHRVFYNVSGTDDTTADQGIQYRTGGTTDGQEPDFSLGALTGQAPASPGTVDPTQVPAELVAVPADEQAPDVTDLTADELDPSADAVISHEVTDDVQARTVTLHLRSSADEDFVAHTLRRTDGDRFDHAIPAPDLTGKRWFEYYLVASDGTHETRTETTRVGLTGVDTAPLRMNLDEGEFVSGTTAVSVAGDEHPASVRLAIDGDARTDAVPALESAPVFAMGASQTDVYFRNGILVGDEVVEIFDEGFYGDWVTVDAEVPLQHVVQGDQLVVTVAAGTKAYPGIDEDENNDDFSIRDLRLVLPDGRTLRPAGHEDPAEIIAMGDSAGKHDLLDAVFTLPEDAFTAQSITWDTTAVEDGEHLLTGTDESGHSIERIVVVDNTAPVITSGIEDGITYQGEFALGADIQDAGSGVEEVTATLDGEAIELPHTTSSLDLEPGEHTFVITAVDALGNESTETRTLVTPEETPSVTALTEDGTTVPVCSDQSVAVEVADPSGDLLDVSFRAGTSASLAEGTVGAVAGEVRDADAAERTGETLTAGDTTASVDALPFHEFAVDVPDSASEGAEVRLTWSGAADPGARVRLLLESAATGELVEIAHTFAAEDGTVAFDEVAPTSGHVVDGQVRAVVQHSVGWSGADLSTRESAVTPHHPEATDRSEYDFTLAWESDTQYYNEEFYEHQLNIHEFLLEEREELNLQYLFHTGDIVDEYDDPAQWANADPAYRMLDDAELPYNVIAGNHDVGSMSNDYTQYKTFFGEDRYQDNPWYGDFYEDNRGSVTLFSTGGVDFVVVSQGWGPGDEEIAWMNEMLARYPERTAILNLHEYMLTTGGLGPIPQQIQDEVVATNPNVSMVMSGHYHDAHTRVDSFDDDGDGTTDREVTQMLFDYQGLPEGGQGFLRLLHFDNEGERMLVRTYSPSLEQYSSDDPTLTPEDQDFAVSYEQLGITPQEKELSTLEFSADVLGEQEFALVEGVATEGGEAASTVTVDVSSLGFGTHSWYALVTDPHGGVARSEVRELTLTPGGPECAQNGGGKPGKPRKPGKPDHAGGPGTPAAPGKPGRSGTVTSGASPV
ncbi:lamin tail domain-containing protein [Brachybacterium sp.]|uniref:lamin tail domain-containing protein n=1 Tax=Brachybacterium sp. TaxID=1891286 RepID=UPI002ED3A8C6